MTVRNEKDMLFENLQYHLSSQDVDIILVMDHGSRDGSGYVGKKLQDPRVVTIKSPGETGYKQDVFFTAMAEQLFTQYDCDWVAPVDADEFCVSHEHGTLREVLETIPDDVDALGVSTFNMRSTYKDPDDPYFLSRQRYGIFSKTQKSILRNVGNRLENYGFGGHPSNLKCKGKINFRYVDHDTLVRYHYNHTSCHDTIRKTLNQVEGFIMAYGDRWLRGQTEYGSHILKWYNMILQGTFEEYYQQHFILEEKRLNRLLKGGKARHLTEMAEYAESMANV